MSTLWSKNIRTLTITYTKKNPWTLANIFFKKMPIYVPRFSLILMTSSIFSIAPRFPTSSFWGPSTCTAREFRRQIPALWTNKPSSPLCSETMNRSIRTSFSYSNFYQMKKRKKIRIVTNLKKKKKIDKSYHIVRKLKLTYRQTSISDNNCVVSVTIHDV